MQKVIGSKLVSNVEELINVLKPLAASVGTHPSAIYLEGATGMQTLAVHVIEQKLTDGSLVYNLIIRESVAGGGR